jgi:hypothetical protein
MGSGFIPQDPPPQISLHSTIEFCRSPALTPLDWPRFEQGVKLVLRVVQRHSGRSSFLPDSALIRIDEQWNPRI